MGTHQALKVFEDKRIRTFWNDTEEKWYFSIADVVSALTDSQDVKQYIKRLRARDKELGSVWGTICTPPSIRLHRWETTFLKLLRPSRNFSHHPVHPIQESRPARRS